MMNTLMDVIDILSYSMLLVTITAVTGTVGYWASRWMKSQALQSELGHLKKVVNGRRN